MIQLPSLNRKAKASANCALASTSQCRPVKHGYLFNVYCTPLKIIFISICYVFSRSIKAVSFMQGLRFAKYPAVIQRMENGTRRTQTSLIEQEVKHRCNFITDDLRCFQERIPQLKSTSIMYIYAQSAREPNIKVAVI